MVSDLYHIKKKSLFHFRLCIYTSFLFYFVSGKVNQAKGFVFQIADLGRNRHRFAYLDNKSVSKYCLHFSFSLPRSERRSVQAECCWLSCDKQHKAMQISIRSVLGALLPPLFSLSSQLSPCLTCERQVCWQCLHALQWLSYKQVKGKW